MSEAHDVLGIGVGPFNLGLAALLSGVDDDVDAAFLEREAEFNWHEGMLLDGATLEVPFLADLVTLADPTNPHSYLNYLRETGRIYEFYFYETFQTPRTEYNDYLQWVTGTSRSVSARGHGFLTRSRATPKRTCSTPPPTGTSATGCSTPTR